MIVVASRELDDKVVWTSPHGDTLTFSFWLRAEGMARIHTRMDEALHWIRDANWQETRLFMKGKTTHEKIEVLENWLDRCGWSEGAHIQVDNYLNALRRGGQLPPKNWKPNV